MALKEMPKVGDKVRYIGKEGAVNSDVTYGTVYSISTIHAGFAGFVDDTCEDETAILYSNFDKFELVTEEETSVTDILANLALRVSELERHNREQAYEINELYKAVSK